MDAFCKKCDEYKYAVERFTFVCSVSGQKRRNNSRCNLEGKFKPYPHKYRDLKKEAQDAREGKSGVHEGLPKKESEVRKEEPKKSDGALSGDSRNSVGKATKKLESKKKAAKKKKTAKK